MIKNNLKIGVIGDMHEREQLGYADHIADRRIPEKQEILDFIVKSFEDCQIIIFMGDQLHSRNSSPHTTKGFINFIERFKGKELYFILGNHEKYGDGRSALDYLKEVKEKNWTIVSKDVHLIQKENKVLTFCPYFNKSELGIKENKEATEEILKRIGKGDILFLHHAIMDTPISETCTTNDLPEPVLPRKELEKNFKLSVAGHIHAKSHKKNVLIAGSIFNNEVEELQKYIHIVDLKDLKVEEIKLPGRRIYKIENPTKEDIEKVPEDSIVKAVITKRLSTAAIEELKGLLSARVGKKGTYVFLEQVPRKRKKLHYASNEGLLEFDVVKLLEVYAKEKELSLVQLQRGFDLLQ